MYKQISARPPVNQIYSEQLLQEGIVSQEILAADEQKVSQAMESTFGKQPEECKVGFSDKWQNISSAYCAAPVATGVTAETLLTLARKLAELPPGFMPHPKILNLIQKRFESVLKGQGIDWGNAETLAYATLLDQGVSVRISGQDSRRGTFNHRHCVLIDNNDECSYTPLKTVAGKTAGFQAWNSLLSEFGVLGFEYGYSLETPQTLTIWEAQFGDFANGAQVVIDQFIAAGETKWNRASGLVMLLPHGYEGQGGEHSSARIERFLQLCAQKNMVLVCPSSPSQLFHLLRRQMLQTFRKPLVVFTPKSLLRHPRCISSMDELIIGGFHNIIEDIMDLSLAERILFCSGKLYYELVEERERLGKTDVAIVRIEQLYPLDSEAITGLVKRCSADCRFYWVQEEPENMGSWQYMRHQFEIMSIAISYVGRLEDACPAVGSHHLHLEQQAEILNKAFFC
jgi:2-oxoglutarate dehydrogenase E1 component